MSSAVANPIEVFSGELSARDFKVCAHCGQPIATVPIPQRDKFQFNDQLWQCLKCGRARKWGENDPADGAMCAALQCKPCGAVTRHGFLKVCGR